MCCLQVASRFFKKAAADHFNTFLMFLYFYLFCCLFCFCFAWPCSAHSVTAAVFYLDRRRFHFVNTFTISLVRFKIFPILTLLNTSCLQSDYILGRTEMKILMYCHEHESFIEKSRKPLFDLQSFLKFVIRGYTNPILRLVSKCSQKRKNHYQPLTDLLLVATVSSFLLWWVLKWWQFCSWRNDKIFRFEIGYAPSVKRRQRLSVPFDPARGHEVAWVGSSLVRARQSLPPGPCQMLEKRYSGRFQRCA